ncbi:MAG: beta-L-arabinofuranosidase domain-containing protein [Limisphaerales bacterium]
MNRREFLGVAATASATILAGRGVALAAGGATDAPPKAGKRSVLETFDFSGVKLRDSRWQQQYARTRDFYFQIPNDDILHGFRQAAGLPAPRQPLGGWCGEDSYQVFGHWLMAMSRASRANNDTELREKASFLLTEWGKTLDRNPDARGHCKFQQVLAADRGSHYFFDKMAGGLVDMHQYADHPEALPLLEKITDWAITLLRRDRLPGSGLPNEKADGFPLEWYTLGENLFRAFEVTRLAKYWDFADVWLYPDFWDRFILTSRPAGAFGQHAYSHCNTLSSAAMAYVVSGEPKYLQIIKNAYDFFQETQCYATGGYGPAERILPMDGALGESLRDRADTFECPCGTWAAFKLSKYLMQITGEARYGDWIEKLLYNGIGAALPMTGRGRTFYYANYLVGGATKTYFDAAFPCCSGTYFQDVTEYHNLIYFRDAASLCVNLFLPSEVTWKTNGAEVKLIQETNYPEEDTVRLKLELSRPAQFPLKFRVPGWSRGVYVKVNGTLQNTPTVAGTWAVLLRLWYSGDQVEIRIPLLFRRQPIDAQHPNRVALLRGPLVLVQDLAANASQNIPNDEDLGSWLAPSGRPGVFHANSPIAAEFTGYYLLGESQPYRMYFDSPPRRPA